MQEKIDLESKKIRKLENKNSSVHTSSSSFSSKNFTNDLRRGIKQMMKNGNDGAITVNLTTMRRAKQTNWMAV